MLKYFDDEITILALLVLVGVAVGIGAYEATSPEAGVAHRLGLSTLSWTMAVTAFGTYSNV